MLRKYKNSTLKVYTSHVYTKLSYGYKQKKRYLAADSSTIT